MAEWNPNAWKDWSAPIRISVILLLGAGTLALIYLLFSSGPKPIQPSSTLFEPVRTDEILADSRPELSDFDFIFRPIFSTERRPPKPPEEAASSEITGEKSVDDVAVRSMEGSHLLGIFGSGEVEGAIVRLDNGQKRRLVLGDKLEGWTLQSVSAREIRFVAETGEVANLDMILSRAQEPLAHNTVLPEGQNSVRPGQGESAADSGEANGQGEDIASESRGFTFDSMYRDRYQEASQKETAE